MLILMQILELFLRQFTCASVGELKNFDNIKMHGMYLKIVEEDFSRSVHPHLHGITFQKTEILIVMRSILL
jgi:hypothetical protein